MRSKEVQMGHDLIYKMLVPIYTRLYEAGFPEDCKQETSSSCLIFTPDRKMFTVPLLVANDIALLNQARQENSDLEYAVCRVRDGEHFYRVGDDVLIGTPNGIGVNFLPAANFETGESSDFVYPSYVDFMHTHLPGKNEFSVRDLWYVGATGMERMWLVGSDDIVRCLINPHGRQYKDDIEHSVNQWVWESSQSRFEAFLESLLAAKLLYYESNDGETFKQPIV